MKNQKKSLFSPGEMNSSVSLTSGVNHIYRPKIKTIIAILGNFRIFCKNLKILFAEELMVEEINGPVFPARDSDFCLKSERRQPG